MMKKRYTVLGLTVVFALALAVPALGGPTNPLASASKSVQSIANSTSPVFAPRETISYGSSSACRLLS